MSSVFKPLVSVIIPVYKAEKYLRTCLDSILNQTYKNIEVICVNDGSPDNSISVLYEYASCDKRVIVYDEPNKGVASARNLGIEKAAGEFLTFADADDWWECNAFERAVEEMGKHSADVVMYSYYRDYANKTLERNNMFPNDFMVFDEDQSVILRKRLFGLIGDELKRVENFDTNNALWSKLYRTEIFKKHQEVRYPDNKRIGSGGDGLLNVYYFKYVKRAVYIADHLYHYRKTNDESIVSSYKPDFFQKRKRMFALYNQVITDEHLEKEYSDRLSNRIAVSIIGVGLQELLATHSSRRKIHNIRAVLGDDEYQKALQGLPLKYMPFYWRAFFVMCRLNIAFIVYILLLFINKLKQKV